MLFFILFIVELISLFFISKSLINNLAKMFYRLTKSHTGVVNCLAILFLPGTIIHELSHLLVAGIMLVPVGELEALPVIKEGGVQLGSVQIAQTDPFRRALIGVAPFLVGMLVILGVIYFNKQALLSLTPLWQILLTLYAIFEVANTMFSSKKDLEGVVSFGAAILIVAILVFAVLYFTGSIGLLSFLQRIDYTPVLIFFKTAAIFMMIPLLIDLMMIGVMKITS